MRRPCGRKGEFVTTNVIVRTEFLEQYPDAVEAFLDGHVAALKAIEDDPQASAEAANASLKSLTGSSLATDVLTAAWANVTFTADPLPATLKASPRTPSRSGCWTRTRCRRPAACPGRCMTSPC